MSDLYEGPAVLIADDGTEISVRARLAARPPERVFVNIGGAFDEYVPAGYGDASWYGTIEAADTLVGHRLCIPGTLRFPNGKVGEFDYMSGDTGTPDRVEVEAKGAAPWTGDTT